MTKMEARTPQSRGGGDENMVGPPYQIRRVGPCSAAGVASKPKPGLHRVLKLAIARLVPEVSGKDRGPRMQGGRALDGQNANRIDVCFWHKADMAIALIDVRFWG